jgi:hypothetical protein
MDSSLYSSSWPPSIPEQQQHAQHEQRAQPTSIVDDWAKDRSNPIPQSGSVASPPMASPTIDMSDFTLGGDFSGQSQHELACFKLSIQLASKVPQIRQYYLHLHSLSTANMVILCNHLTTQWLTALLGLHLLLFPSLIIPHLMARQPIHPHHLQLNPNSNPPSNPFNNLQPRSKLSNSRILQRLII